MLSRYRLLLFIFLFLILIGCTYLLLKKPSYVLRIYDLEAFAHVSVRLPPTTAEEAIYVAFSLPDVKSGMTIAHQRFLEWATSVAHLKKEPVVVFWFASADSSIRHETQERRWHIVFRSNVIPAYICDISFDNTVIMQGVADVACGYQKK